MILTGRPQACLRYLDAADHILQVMQGPDADSLSARIHRLRGEALLRTDPQKALVSLNLARQWLESREPWAYAEVMVLAGIAHRQLHEFAAALAAHATAVDIFTRNHDDVASSYALSELCTTLRAAGTGPVRARWVRHVIGKTA
jgi:hypothetical protein